MQGYVSVGYSNSMQLLLARWCLIVPSCCCCAHAAAVAKLLHHEGVQMPGELAKRLGYITTGSAHAVFMPMMGTPGESSAALPSV
jgi:hypothetical protein